MDARAARCTPIASNTSAVLPGRFRYGARRDRAGGVYHAAQRRLDHARDTRVSGQKNRNMTKPVRPELAPRHSRRRTAGQRSCFDRLSTTVTTFNVRRCGATRLRLLALSWCSRIVRRAVLLPNLTLRSPSSWSPPPARAAAPTSCAACRRHHRQEKLLPQPVFVSQGGGGARWDKRIRTKRGDPYTFLLARQTGRRAHTHRRRRRVDKFQTLGAIVFDTNAPRYENSPYRTLKDLLADARDKPKTISVGTTLPGGAHAMMHRLEKLSARGSTSCRSRAAPKP